MNIDHVVIWVEDQKRSLSFFTDVVGLEPVRAEKFSEGAVGFPSVRVSERAIIDLMDKSKASGVQEFTGGSNEAGGWLTNHVCFSMDREDGRLLALHPDLFGRNSIEPHPGQTPCHSRDKTQPTLVSTGRVGDTSLRRQGMVR